MCVRAIKFHLCVIKYEVAARRDVTSTGVQKNLHAVILYYIYYAIHLTHRLIRLEFALKFHFSVRSDYKIIDE